MKTPAAEQRQYFLALVFINTAALAAEAIGFL